MAQQLLASEIAFSGIMFEGAVAVKALKFRFEPRRIADVDAYLGQPLSEALHILLRIAAGHSKRVQLHDLTGVVLIDVSRDIFGSCPNIAARPDVRSSPARDP